MNKPEEEFSNLGIIVTAVVMDKTTESFVVAGIRDRRNSYMFPGGCAKSVDVDPSCPNNQEATAHNALKRILKDRFNLTGITTRLVEVKEMASGDKLYIYLVDSSFQGMTTAPYIQTCSDDQLPLLNMPKTHKQVLACVISAAGA